jgi:hypothetical protein
VKDEALALVAGIADPAQKLNLLREYLQAFTLRALSESEAFVHLAFVGGTALRFLYGLPRFSEDLDFSLEDERGYEPVRWLEKLKRDLSLAGYEPELSWNPRKVVQDAWIRLPVILHEAGIAGRPEQKLSIKLEIDTRPPAGAQTEMEVLQRHVLFTVRHHDLESLMAGKVHALLTRPYTKGRDWYDLLWYYARRPRVEPNLTLLQNALDQTQGRGVYDASGWREQLKSKLDELDEARMIEDVRFFLERAEDVRLMTRASFERLLKA